MKNLILILFLCVFFNVSAQEKKQIFKITEYEFVPSEKGEMPVSGSKYCEMYFNFRGQKIQKLYFDTSGNIQSVRLYYYDNQDACKRLVDLNNTGNITNEEKIENPKLGGFLETMNRSCCGTIVKYEFDSNGNKIEELDIEELDIDEYTLKIKRKIVLQYEYYN